MCQNQHLLSKDRFPLTMGSKGTISRGNTLPPLEKLALKNREFPEETALHLPPAKRDPQKPEKNPHKRYGKIRKRREIGLFPCRRDSLVHGKRKEGFHRFRGTQTTGTRTSRLAKREQFARKNREILEKTRSHPERTPGNRQIHRVQPEGTIRRVAKTAGKRGHFATAASRGAAKIGNNRTAPISSPRERTARKPQRNCGPPRRPTFHPIPDR